MTKKIILMLFLIFSKNIVAQKYSGEDLRRMENLKTLIDSLVNVQKNTLKENLKKIDNQLKTNEISPEIAKLMRDEAIDDFKKNIQANRLKIIEKEFKTTENAKKMDSLFKNDQVFLEKNQKMLDSVFQKEKNEEKKRKSVISYEYFADFPKKERKRVQGGLNFALAFHNLNSKEHFSNDNFRIWGSKSVEIGYQRNVRLLENNNLLHFSYGLSWMMNKLKMKDSEWFVNNNGITEIQPFKTDVIKSKFKSHYLILPLNLELDFTPSYSYKDKNYYPIHRSFRFGIGAYVGLHLGNKQKVKYRESGYKYKNVSHANYNVNEWIYGVSAHLGVGKSVFYARYSLVPLFRNNAVKEYPFSLGIRWDCF